MEEKKEVESKDAINDANKDTITRYKHVLPGEHVYDGVLFFGYTPPDILDAIKDFPVREDDVFIATYPKAGTTWLQEIVWLIMNDGDFQGASEKPVYFRSPFLEFKDEVLKEVGLELSETIPSPRVIKTHLQFKLMPRQIQTKPCKIVCLFRNPKDLCVSYYHFYRSSSSFGSFEGTWEDFFDMFIEGQVDHGSWFDYTFGWWEQRKMDNIQIYYYENMKENLRSEVCRLCNFLGKSISDDVIDKIVRHCGFENMKGNPMTNHLDVYSINSQISPLLRKGTVGDWKNRFTVTQNERFDKIYNDIFAEKNIPFKYELP